MKRQNSYLGLKSCPGYDVEQNTLWYVSALLGDLEKEANLSGNIIQNTTVFLELVQNQSE